MTEKREWDYLLKFLLIGDSSVGKTSLLLRYTDNTFSDAFIATIGVDFKVKKMELNGKKLKIQVVSGQEKFHTITQSYYRGSNGVIVVYDCTDRKTFENCKSWLDESAAEISKSAVRLLVGNKCDMQKTVSTEDGADFAKSQDISFMEVSAKNNTNVQEAFVFIITEVLKRLETEGANEKQSDIDLKKGKGSDRKKSQKEKCYLL
ncbi:hypothetical protein EIN_476200 [Entamoeba invadens IP1]|uniref:Uncharacterized protein n=1 Tax=Entamoeba invadens IP1 TaxID=370355 RepID=A0A0A1U3W1_ENTIV|nr:hypothetical protein EIN_476200 [Entamoeba invadens IP1]ELP88908.1 hypothetical protein EIN_476200 [Entamoeba invadens IP1]|eukprot:XP_004255679.1 hypothetical protein EIN_476200 [Entamoeba invadens IP1]